VGRSVFQIADFDFPGNGKIRLLTLKGDSQLLILRLELADSGGGAGKSLVERISLCSFLLGLVDHVAVRRTRLA